MAPISFPRKGSRLLTLVPTFYVLKEQRGKRALVRASVWRFNGRSKGFAPARQQVVEQQTSGLAVLGSHEGKPSGQRSLICCESSGERKLRRFREGRHHECGSFQKRRLEQVFRRWVIGRDSTSVVIDNARHVGTGRRPQAEADAAQRFGSLLQAPSASRTSAQQTRRSGLAAVCIRHGIRCERRSSAECQAGGMAGRSVRTL